MQGADREFVVVDDALHVHQARTVGAGDVFGARGEVVAYFVASHAGRNSVLLDGKHTAEAAALVDARGFGDFDAFDHREQVAQFRMIGQVQLARRTEPELA